MRGERTPKKTRFSCQTFQKKGLKTHFSACFFSKFCLWRRSFGKNRVFVMIWESSENQFGRPEKNSRQNFFENPPPHPLDKILDPPLSYFPANHENFKLLAKKLLGLSVFNYIQKCMNCTSGFTQLRKTGTKYK